MNITRESTGELTSIVKIEIGPADYTEAVDKVIQDYKRKANIPGFRPGHVPAGLIRKMYGKSILAEEVNKLISDNLMQYIKDENLDILGNPLPNPEKNSVIDFEHESSFEFFFDLGLAPAFTVPFGKETEVEYLQIRIDDEMIDHYIDETRKRFGKKAEPENAETPVDEEKKEPEVIPADLNPEFYARVYPGLNIETEEDFREQVKKDAANGFSAETDKLFFHNVTEKLVKETDLNLPDTFLKRWIVENNEGKFSAEEVEKDYGSFAESMRWQLIENRIIKDHHIEVKDEDIRNYIKTTFLRQLPTDNPDPEIQKKYDSIVDAFMQNKEQIQRINDQLYRDHLLMLFKSELGVADREVSYDEFIKLASVAQPHHHDHAHGDDHDHDHGHEHEDHGEENK